MDGSRFLQLGKIIYGYRVLIIILFLCLVIIGIPTIPKAIHKLTDTGFVDPYSESAFADKFLRKNLHYYHNRFIIMYQGNKKFNHDANFSKEIKNSLTNVKDLPYHKKIIYPDENKDQISKNEYYAYAVILLEDNKEISENVLEKIKNSIKKPSHLRMLIDGEPIFIEDIKKQTQADLIKAEYIATPIAVITLLIVFGSVMAAMVPMLLDGVCAVFILSLLFFFTRFAALSVFTLNIALLLGLCLSLDYSLFIISRFREELRIQGDVKQAIAVTEATAGKAIFFSGLAVLISLSALLLFPINILFSVGIGGIIAVAVAVIVCVIFLPAVLAALGKRIDFLPIRLSRAKRSKAKLWHWIVIRVIRYPWTFFMLSLLILLTLSYPFFSVQFGISDYRILPKYVSSRVVFDLFKNEFKPNQLTPITAVIKTQDNNILSKTHIKSLYNYAKEIRLDDRVHRVESIVTTKPQLQMSQYQQLYSDKKDLNKPLKDLLELTTNKNFTVMTIVSNYPSDSVNTENIVKMLRVSNPGNDLTLQVTGVTANNLDVFKKIGEIFPYAVLWIILLTYIILLVLLRSLFLPFKAIVMNILSLSASYGVLVFVIQKGYFSSLLNFQPAGMIDISLLIIIFCALFGFSMDYEVFLLSRIQEHHQRTGDNIESIRYGIIHSSRIITSAAIVVILICIAFLSADILLVKAFGLGIAVAIFIDAFLVRIILVPATMALFKQWNWYLPKWLDRILPNTFQH